MSAHILEKGNQLAYTSNCRSGVGVCARCGDSAMRGTFIKSGCKVAVKRRPGKMVWFLPFTTGRCEIEQMPPCFGKNF